MRPPPSPSLLTALRRLELALARAGNRFGRPRGTVMRGGVRPLPFIPPEKMTVRTAEWKVLIGLALLAGTWPALGAPPKGEDPKTTNSKPGDANEAAVPLPPGAVDRFRSARLRTTATVFALSADGKVLQTVAGARTIGRWDTKTGGRLLGEVELKTPTGAECWFSPDRRFVAALDSEGVGLYDAESGERKRTVAPNDKSGMLVAAFSPDGLTLATSEYETKGGGLGVGRVRLFPVAGGKAKLLAELPSYVNALAFSADGKRLYAAVDNHSLRCFDVKTAEELWKNDHWARHLAVSLDGKRLASDLYQNGPLQLWNAETGEKIATLDTGKRSWSRRVAFGPDGKTVGFGTNDGVQIWDAATRKLLHTFAGSGPDLAFAPDGASVFTLGPLIERWDLKTGKPLYPDARSAGHVGSVAAVACAPDGRSLATVGTDSTLRVWDRVTGEHRVHNVRPGAICPLIFTPGGRLITLGAENGTLSHREADSGREIRKFALPQKPQSSTDLMAARLTEDGKTLLVLGQTQLSLSDSSIVQERRQPVLAWDIATGKVVLEQSIPCRPWAGAAFSPSGRFIAREGMAELLDVWTGRSRPLAPKSPAPYRLCTFSPDGRWMATLEPGEGMNWQMPKAVFVYEVLTGRPIARLAIAACKSIAFSPDGRLLVASGVDALHVLQVSTGQELLHLPAKGRLTDWAGSGFSVCSAFAPDGQTVATGHGDGTVLLWDLAPAWKNLTAPKGAVDPAACWNDLANSDPKIAWAAIDRLAANPAAALKLLGVRLKPVTVDARWAADRIAELSSKDFKTREAATSDLKRVAEVARPLLMEARRASTSAEGQQRLDEVLDYAPPLPSDDAARGLRALAVLERIGTQAAVGALKALAEGAPDAELTREAVAARGRLRTR